MMHSESQRKESVRMSACRSVCPEADNIKGCISARWASPFISDTETCWG